MTVENAPLAEGISFLYQHLSRSKQIVDVTGFNPDILHVFSKEVLSMLQEGNPEWENMVPPKIATLIKEKFLFGYPMERMEFEY